MVPVVYGLGALIDALWAVRLPMHFVQHGHQNVECIAAFTHCTNAVVGACLWSESSYKIVLEVLTGQATDANSQITCSLTQAFNCKLKYKCGARTEHLHWTHYYAFGLCLTQILS